MKKHPSPNMNYAWSGVMIRELMRLGVKAFFIAPGSRSSPLAITAAELAGDHAYVHFDERGLGFLAIGHARATGKPAVIITTSGTAVANLLPAVCEASMDDVPMIVVTADRPPELRGNGANQSMDQVKLFGSYARWQMDLPCPTHDVSAEYVASTIDQAFFKATAIHPGPVHINQMFREPLAPIAAKDQASRWEKSSFSWRGGSEPFTALHAPEGGVMPPDVAAKITGARRGVIIAGSVSSAIESETIAAIAKRLNWPVLPDIRSGLRFSSHEPVINSIEALMIAGVIDKRFKPDVAIHIGRQVVSKRLLKYESSASEVIAIYPSPARHDPQSVHTERIVAALQVDQQVNQALVESLPAKTRTPSAWLSRWQAMDGDAGLALSKYIDAGFRIAEPIAAALAVKMAAPDSIIVAASSMPVRDLNAYAVEMEPGLGFVANRGVSGVEGTVATAVGYAMASGKAVTLVIGDQALLYDLNSLALIRHGKAPFTVLVINNDGGGIFSMLPLAGTTPHFEKVFGARHGLNGFSHAASLFGLDYKKPSDLTELADMLKKNRRSGHKQMIEVATSREQNVIDHQHLGRYLEKALKKHGA